MRRQYLLALNGELEATPALFHFLSTWQAEGEMELLVVDGGWRHVDQLPFSPQRVLGDLDSLPSAAWERIQREQIPCERFPRAKDWTDAELAVRSLALEEGDRLLLLGAYGQGRMDHVAGNEALAWRLAREGFEIWLSDGETFFHPLIGPTSFSYHWERQRPSFVSLLCPQGAKLAAGPINTQGLAYPLEGDFLASGELRGMSNLPHPTSQQFQLELATGELSLYIVYSQHGEEGHLPDTAFFNRKNKDDFQ